MTPFRVVYPHGAVESASAVSVPDIGSEYGGYRVDFIGRGPRDETTVYLGLFHGQAEVVKLVFLRANGEKCPITLAEAAELAHRLRKASAGRLASAATTVAVTLEQLVEDPAGSTPEIEFRGSEAAALRDVIEKWLFDSGEPSVPTRVMVLGDALERAAGP